MKNKSIATKTQRHQAAQSREHKNPPTWCGFASLCLSGEIAACAQMLAHFSKLNAASSCSTLPRVRLSSRRYGGATLSWHSAFVSRHRSHVPSISNRVIDGSRVNRTARSNSSSQRNPSDTDEVAEGFSARCRAIATHKYLASESTNRETCASTIGSTSFFRLPCSRSRFCRILIASHLRQ